MSTRSIRPLFAAVLLLGATVFIAAQDASNSKTPPPNEGELPIESDWKGPAPTLYGRGDQTFIISLGANFPTAFVGESGVIDNQIYVGGTGSLNYNYYLNPYFALGGEIGGMFASTIGENMLYIVPFGLKLTWHYIATPFEFPVSVVLGTASTSYLDTGYLGLYVKPGVGAYWRFNPDWSFGLNTEWWWVPQWTGDDKTTVYGNFCNLTLSARYHF